MDKYTDTELLDFLQHITDKKQYTGRVILRDSINDRGWRLHETSNESAGYNVRLAIAEYINDCQVKTQGEQ